MVSYYKKIYILKDCESWFSYPFNLKNIFSFNVSYHLKNTAKWIPAVKVYSHTLEVDLQKDINLIFANFSKQIRQQVKVSEKEGTTCHFKNDVESFVAFFNEFAVKKNTYQTSESRIKDIGENLKLSFAINNGVILAAHSYLIDKEIGIVRNLHSATKRLDENYDRNLIGRANKFLTVTDIIYFKEQGFKIFDFGGFAKDTENESLKGINNYKLQFGGELVRCTNYYSFNYWILKKISKLLNLSGKV